MSTIYVKPYRNNNISSTAYGKWFMQVHLNPPLTVEDVANHISLDSKVERTKVAEVTRAVVKQIEELLCNGHAISIPHLGVLKLGVTSVGAPSATEFSANRHIKDLYVLLRPDAEIKEALGKMKFEKFIYEDALKKQEERLAAKEEAGGDDDNGQEGG